MIGGWFRYFLRPLEFMDLFTLYGGGKGGGGGGSAPAPDPLIGQAALAQANLAKAEYEDFKTNVWPVLQKQSQAQSDASVALQKQQLVTTEKNQVLADRYQSRMENEFYPIQDKVVQDAKDYNTDGNFERQAALAEGDVNTQFTNQRNQQRMQMQSYGIDPTSGRYQGQENASNVMQAATAAAAGTKARDAAVQLGWAKNMDAISLGQGLPGNQATSTGLALNAGNSSLAAGGQGIAATQALGNSYTQGYGGVSAGYGASGNLMLGQYGQQISAYNAQQAANAQQSAGMGSGIGTLLGATMSGGSGGFATSAMGMAMGMSDIRTKDNIETLGKLPNGLTLYVFEYKPEFKSHKLAGHGRFIGYMAHEVEELFPEAVFETDGGYKAIDYSKVN